MARRKWTAPGPSKYNLGEEIKTIEQLYRMAIECEAVYVKNLRRHVPATVIIHMQCITVLSWLSRGWIIKIKPKL